MNKNLYAQTEQLKRVIQKNWIESLRIKISRIEDSNPIKKVLQKGLEKQQDQYEQAYHLFWSDWQKEMYE